MGGRAGGQTDRQTDRQTQTDEAETYCHAGQLVIVSEEHLVGDAGLSKAVMPYLQLLLCLNCLQA